MICIENRECIVELCLTSAAAATLSKNNDLVVVKLRCVYIVYGKQREKENRFMWDFIDWK